MSDPSSSHASTAQISWEYLGMPQKKPYVRVVGYPRVSDDSIKIDSGTLESQAKAIRLYCDKQGFTLLDTLPEAMTAYMKPFRERPQFMKVMDMARKGLIDAVVVTEFSRLSRRQGEQAVIVELLRGYHVKVYSCTENFDESALGQFMRAAAAFSAESEREKVVYRTQRGMQDRVESGHLAGRGFAAYGYNYAHTEKYMNSRYVINEEEAKWVRWMYEKATQGWSIRQIARGLTDLGVPTKTQRKPFWHYGTVRQILSDPMYCGKGSAFRYKKNEKNGLSVKVAQIGNVQLSQDVIPAIVSEEVYEQTQVLLPINKQLSFRNAKHPKDQLMRTLVRCSICGHTMHAKHHVKKGRLCRVEYFCQRAAGGTDPTYNHYVTITTRTVDELAWAKAVEFIKCPELIRARIEQLTYQEEEVIDTERVIEMLEDVRKRYRRLFDLAEETTDDDTYAELKTRLLALEKEKHELEQMLKEKDAEEEECVAIAKEIERFERWANEVRPLLADPEYQPTFEEKRAAILVLGIRAVVCPATDEIMNEARVQIEVSPPLIIKALREGESCGVGLTMAESCERLPAPMTMEPAGSEYSPMRRS